MSLVSRLEITAANNFRAIYSAFPSLGRILCETAKPETATVSIRDLESCIPQSEATSRIEPALKLHTQCSVYTKRRYPAFQLGYRLQQSFSTSSIGQSGDKDSDAAIREKIIVVSLPQLSPHMKNGKISKWLKKPGDAIAEYDVICEVDTDNLSEDAYKVGDFAGTVTMLVEAQEEGFLSQILVEEGQLVDIQTPVGIMCEFEEDVAKLQNQNAEEIVKSQSKELRSLTWQSYLKNSDGKSKGCS